MGKIVHKFIPRGRQEYTEINVVQDAKPLDFVRYIARHHGNKGYVQDFANSPLLIKSTTRRTDRTTNNVLVLEGAHSIAAQTESGIPGISAITYMQESLAGPKESQRKMYHDFQFIYYALRERNIFIYPQAVEFGTFNRLSDAERAAIVVQAQAEA